VIRTRAANASKTGYGARKNMFIVDFRDGEAWKELTRDDWIRQESQRASPSF
jgi:hypothetical protein